VEERNVRALGSESGFTYIGTIVALALLAGAFTVGIHSGERAGNLTEAGASHGPTWRI